MGEMADYLSDLAMQQQFEFDELILDMLKCTDEELYLKSKHSSNKLVRGIREFYNCYPKLSEKQRYRLAEWIVENEEI